MDVAKEGIALYEADDRQLHVPKPKTPEQALAMAKEYFEEWFPSAARFRSAADHLKNEGGLKEAAFTMHQAAERLYHCVLLVCTFYTPHVHNLGFLRTQAERIDMRLVEKLKEAYVKARYSKHYRISEEELMWLGEQIEELGRVVHSICSERITALETEAPPAG